MRKLLVSFFCVGGLAALCAAAGMPAIDSRVPPLFTGHEMTNETVLFFHGHGRRRAIDVQGGRDPVRDKLFPEYEKALCALVEKYRAAGFAQIGCANVNTMHAAVLARKRYRDMTGNNINHCNDFSARIYRDTILAAMGILP